MRSKHWHKEGRGRNGIESTVMRHLLQKFDLLYARLKPTCTIALLSANHSPCQSISNQFLLLVFSRSLWAKRKTVAVTMHQSLPTRRLEHGHKGFTDRSYGVPSSVVDVEAVGQKAFGQPLGCLDCWHRRSSLLSSAIPVKSFFLFLFGQNGPLPRLNRLTVRVGGKFVLTKGA